MAIESKRSSASGVFSYLWASNLKTAVQQLSNPDSSSSDCQKTNQLATPCPSFLLETVITVRTEAQTWHQKGKEEDDIDQTWGCVNWNLKIEIWKSAIGLKMNWQPHTGKQRGFATPHVYNFTTAIATQPELPQMTNEPLNCIQSFLSYLLNSKFHQWKHMTIGREQKLAKGQTIKRISTNQDFKLLKLIGILQRWMTRLYKG